MNKMRVLLLCLVCCCALGLKGQIVADIQNDAVSSYINEVMYTSLEDTSHVADYILSSDTRLDVPRPAVVEVPESFVKFINNNMISVRFCYDKSFAPETTSTVMVENDESGAFIYDVQPGETCYYKMYLMNMLIDWGTLITEGPVRMINLSSMRNVRDLGGWTTSDGRTIKYGKLIRGSELNGMHIADDSDIQHLLDLGVSAELDMRANYEEGNNVSAFGFKKATEVEEDEVPSYLYMNDSGQLLTHLSQYYFLQRWRMEFRFILDNLRIGRTVYFHCRWGADRTGYLSLLLEGLLGVPYDGLIKDYELSCFADIKKSKSDIDPVINFIKGLTGRTLQQKFNTFWVKRVGLAQEEVDLFIDEMLDGEEAGGDVVTSVETLSQPNAVTTYNLLGHRVSPRHRGLILQRQQDGSVRKIVK